MYINAKLRNNCVTLKKEMFHIGNKIQSRCGQITQTSVKTTVYNFRHFCSFVKKDKIHNYIQPYFTFSLIYEFE